jgi:cell division protein FtsL
MRIFNIVAIVVALALAIGLYRAKTEADAARARVAELERQVGAARDEVKALAAEVAVLESPARIEELARRKLGVAPGGAGQPRAASEAGAVLPAPSAGKAP